ncbi:uncharacterized protein LOC128987147 isoform X2 [Macrosteles quadrilineatus]|uniref:uncharacterized protein LOC128987147 isoform X2 n=1 Tax=Macrosteles quadrilineatus TaxID=74068 RepID=UPI0023E2AA0E|nr:uncharacterized protein LOC128987147 isoform X2 [Macrosteles quadrilineatus]
MNHNGITCKNCGTDQTSKWRKKNTMCNACFQWPNNHRGKICNNCNTVTSSKWWKGGTECNACNQYYKNHGGEKCNNCNKTINLKSNKKWLYKDSDGQFCVEENSADGEKYRVCAKCNLNIRRRERCNNCNKTINLKSNKKWLYKDSDGQLCKEDNGDGEQYPVCSKCNLNIRRRERCNNCNKTINLKSNKKWLYKDSDGQLCKEDNGDGEQYPVCSKCNLNIRRREKCTNCNKNIKQNQTKDAYKNMQTANSGYKKMQTGKIM